MIVDFLVDSLIVDFLLIGYLIVLELVNRSGYWDPREDVDIWCTDSSKKGMFT